MEKHHRRDADATIGYPQFSMKKLHLVTLLLVLTGLAPALQAANALEQLESWLVTSTDKRPALETQAFAADPLTKDQADQVSNLLWQDYAANIRASRQAEWEHNQITIGDHTLKLKRKTVGTKPKAGWDLYISMHGGGNAPVEVNDQQWENQIKLYSPPNSLYIAPRAPTDTWNLWHENHVDDLFDRMIEDAIVLADVNPDRVYLMGYSAGGDGVYQLAPRMADRFAAAAMMAGHPNDASPLGLRNLPFTIHVGALDDGYDRNKRAADWKVKLDDLQKQDPDGYIHLVKLHEGRAHWMNREDAEAIPWMNAHTRDRFPNKVVWMQGNAPHDQFYWLATPAKLAATGQLVIANRDAQTITIDQHQKVSSLSILLNDSMLDLDQPVQVTVDGKQLFSAIAPRTIASIHQSMEERGDPQEIFTARAQLELPNK